MKSNQEPSVSIEINDVEMQFDQPDPIQMQEQVTTLPATAFAAAAEHKKPSEPVITCSNSVAEDEIERKPNTLMQIIDDVVSQRLLYLQSCSNNVENREHKPTLKQFNQLFEKEMLACEHQESHYKGYDFFEGKI